MTDSTQNQSQNKEKKAPPVFKSEANDAQIGLALWANYESTGPHVRGSLTKPVVTNGQSEIGSVSVSGFFKLTDKGEVRIELTSYQNGERTNEGVIYLNKRGSKFYKNRKDNNEKAQPVTIIATNAMTQEVADAIGVVIAEPRNSYQNSRAQPSVNNAPVQNRNESENHSQPQNNTAMSEQNNAPLQDGTVSQQSAEPVFRKPSIG